MESMQTFENEKIINERKHSLTWYQNRIIDIFENEFKPKIENYTAINGERYCLNIMGKRRKRKSELYEYYSKAPYDFMTVFARIYCEEFTPIDYDNRDRKREYHNCRIEFFKIMNLITSLIANICEYNIDPSILNDNVEMNISDTRYAFIWLMCYSSDASDRDVQDLNRLFSFFRLQMEIEAMESGVYYSDADIDAQYAALMEQIESKGRDKPATLVSLLKTLKSNLEKLINDTFRVFELLTWHRFYILDLGETFKDDIVCQKSMRYSLVFAKTVCRVFLERFAGFSKMPGLNLGYSKMARAYLTRSDMSDSNFINSDFGMAKMENSLMKNCDFSICNFNRVNAPEANFDNCSFNYSSMVGINLRSASISNSLFDSVIFRDASLDNFDYAAELFDSVSEEVYDLLAGSSDDDDAADVAASARLNTILRLFNRRSEDKRLWKLTVADYDGTSVHLCVTDENGVPTGDYSHTVFDAVFYEVYKELKAIERTCDRRVIPKKAIEVLSAAQRAEPFDPASEGNRICLEISNLAGVTIRNSSMHQIDISHIDMRNASFEASDLSDCVAYYADVRMTSFVKAILGGGEFYRSSLNETNFSGANCINTCFIDCGMNNVNFTDASAIGVTIIDTTREEPILSKILSPLEDIRIDVCSLSESISHKLSFTDSPNTMIESNWSSATATRANFISIVSDRSHFFKTDFRSSLFFNCVTRWCVFDLADLSYALLFGTSFHQSSYNDANLSQSHVFASEFGSCQMLRSNFIGARIDKAVFYDNDLSKSNFSHSLFRNCIFRDCSFNGINMSNVEFIHCVFSNIDFSECIGMNSASFMNCIFADMNYDTIGSDFDDEFDPDFDDSSAVRQSCLRLQKTSNNRDVLVSSSEMDMTGKFLMYSTK